MKRGSKFARALGAGIVLTPVAAAPLQIDNSKVPSPSATQGTLDPVETALLRNEVAGQIRRAKSKAAHKKAVAVKVRKARRAKARKHKLAGASTASPQLVAIANCESHGDPKAIGGGGQYRGKFQMTYSSWASVGGKGDPAAAPEGEQNRRAAALLARSGTSPWPVCGR